MIVTNGPDLVASAEQIVLSALPKRLSDRTLAKMLGVSIIDLRQAFLFERRMPIYTALHALRLDAADRLLGENPVMMPEAAAIQCGFGHYGVFHRNYRLRFGREPGVGRGARHPEATPPNTPTADP